MAKSLVEQFEARTNHLLTRNIRKSVKKFIPNDEVTVTVPRPNEDMPESADKDDD